MRMEASTSGSTVITGGKKKGRSVTKQLKKKVVPRVIHVSDPGAKKEMRWYLRSPQIIAERATAECEPASATNQLLADGVE
jgi:hypothetical protein